MKDETILGEGVDAETAGGMDEDADDATATGDTDAEFEYDEDGNIIIPDVVEDEDEGDEASSEEGDTTEEEDGDDTSAESEPGEGVAEPESAPKASDEIEQLRRRVRELESHGREVLESLGVKEDDVLEGLMAVAAENEGVSVEEYKKKRADAERDEQAHRLLQQQEFERVASADLAELQAAFPETQQYRHITDLPADILRKFGAFRDKGLTAKEAYSAANPDGIRTTVATAVRKRAQNASKGHLRSSVPKGSNDSPVVTIPAKEKEMWRDLFPGKTDKEIEALYRATKT